MINKFILLIEPIQFWNCPKCNKLSGSMQIKFDYLPDILVFYLKRFDQANLIFEVFHLALFPNINKGALTLNLTLKLEKFRSVRMIHQTALNSLGGS